MQATNQLIANIPLNLGKVLDQDELKELLEIVEEEKSTLENVLVESAKERVARRRAQQQQAMHGAVAIPA